MLTDIKRCEKCVYLCTSSHTKGGRYKFCQYMLTTEKRRTVEDGVCLSFKSKRRGER